MKEQPRHRIWVTVHCIFSCNPPSSNIFYNRDREAERKEMKFKISPLYYPGTALFVVPGNGRSKPNFGRKKHFWEERALPVSRWGPRPEPPCSWARCRSSLAHTIRFSLEAAGLGLTDGSSGNAEAGTAAPLRAAESHSCCCLSHSSSLSSSSSQWSARCTPDALPKEQTEDHERKG